VRRSGYCEDGPVRHCSFGRGPQLRKIFELAGDATQLGSFASVRAEEADLGGC